MQVPELAQAVGDLFDHVLVDEYQDTNALQASILLGLKPDGAGLTVVGDDAQAIYGFRAASVRNILDFPTLFNPPATVVTLEQNYRSTQAILAAANAVIAQAPERFTKTLFSDRVGSTYPDLISVEDDAAQAACIATSVLRNREAGIALKDQVVLFRAANHSAQLEIELARRNIPFVKHGGQKFIEAAHIKDVLAVLRWTENPADRVSGFRVLKMLDGIGPTTAGKVLDSMYGRDPCDALAAFRVPAQARADWEDLVQLMRDLRGQQQAWPAAYDRVRAWYQPRLERRHADAPVRAADLDQLGHIAAGYPTRAKFLTDLTLDPPNGSSGDAGPAVRAEDYLTLSTIHSAKGQEWTAVFILNVVEGCIPFSRSSDTSEYLAEELRLLYVAMTRAKDQLSLIVPCLLYVHQHGRRGDSRGYATRSRFLPADILDAFQHHSWFSAQSISSGPPPSGVAVDVGSHLRDRWRAGG